MNAAPSVAVAGQVKVMITNGGPHPPEKWAEVSASEIIDVSPTAPEPQRTEATAFKASLIELLTRMHGGVQERERAALDAAGDARLAEPVDGAEFYQSDMLVAIVSLATGLSFDAVFNDPVSWQRLRDILQHHFRRSMHIERSWWADRNPDGENARRFRAAHHQAAA